MALNPQITTSYAGEFAGKYISASLLSANTLDNGGLTIMPNVKYREVLKTFELNNVVQDGTCDFQKQGDIVLDERYITPKELQVNIDLCRKQFRSDWEAVSMGMSAFDVLPKTFEDYMIGYVGNLVAQTTENNIWKGLDSNNGTFKSISQSLNDQGNYNNVGNGNIDASNVIDALGAVVDGVAPNIYGKEDLKLYVSPKVLRAYVRALGGFGAQGLGGNGTNAQGTQWYNNGALSFDGIPLFLANGMTVLGGDNILLAQTSNLYFGTGLLSDHNEVRIIDMAPIDGSQNYRVVMRYTAGCEVGFAGEVTTWGF